MFKLRLYIAMAVLPFALAWFLINSGQQGMHEARDFKQPVRLSLADFLNKRPKEGWFQVSNCRLDLDDVMSDKEPGKAKEVFIPLVGPGVPKGTNSPVILRTSDPEILRTAADLARFEGTSEAQARQFVIAHAAVMKPQPYQGMVQAGIDVKGKVVKQVATLQGIPQEQLIVIDHNRRPRQMGSSQAMFAGGIGVAALAVLGWGVFLFMKIARRA